MMQALPPAPPIVMSVQQYDPADLPTVRINGKDEKLHDLQLRGTPADILQAKRRAEAEGWTIDAVGPDGTWLDISAMRRKLDELAVLNFRIENGDFGPVKVTAIILPR